MGDRKYFAVSIKHSIYGWKFGKPLMLCGWKRTEEGEQRCYSGHTENPYKAELYALGDFTAQGYNNWPGVDIKDDEPVNLHVKFCNKYKQYDTVLVEEGKYLSYYEEWVEDKYKR